MKSFSIRNALADSSWGIEPGGMIHPAFIDCVYMVREDNDVFYVGMTKSDFGSRLRWHLAIEGRGSYRLSPLGECIVANWPASLDWKVELWKPEEIQREIAPPELKSMRPFGVCEAERCAIRHFRPPLNVAVASILKARDSQTATLSADEERAEQGARANDGSWHAPC